MDASTCRLHWVAQQSVAGEITALHMESIEGYGDNEKLINTVCYGQTAA